MESVENIWKQKHEFFSCSPCARHMAHGEDLSSPCAGLWHTTNNDSREAITRSLTTDPCASHVIHVRRVPAG